MKPFAIMAATALILVGPLANTAHADPPNGYNRDHDNKRRDNDRRRDNDNRRNWDRSRDNGYLLNGRWRFGPPRANVLGRAGFAPAIISGAAAISFLPIIARNIARSTIALITCLRRRAAAIMCETIAATSSWPASPQVCYSA